MKKLFTFVLCLIMILTIIFSGSTAPVESNKSADTQKQQTEESNLTAPGTFPIVKEKINLSVFTYDDGSKNFDTNWFTKYYEDKTNIHVEWRLGLLDSFQEKKSLMFASGDLADIIVAGGQSRASLTRNEEIQYGSQGILIPLNDLIDKFGTEFKKVAQVNPAMKDSITTPDGNIYSLPEVNVCFHCTYMQKMWINTTWLDKLGLSMPKNLDEFEKVLIDFKGKDPNGNGIADEIPLSTCKSGRHVLLDEFLMNSFIYTDGLDRMSITNGKVEFQANKPEYREGLKYINNLYNKGLINPESFTQDQKTQVALNEKGDVPVIGTIPAGHQAYFANYQTLKWTEYDVVPPLEGPNGFKTTSYYAYDNYKPGAFALTKSCKNPEAAFRWVDWLYSEEGTLLSVNGEEGKSWAKADPGQKGIDGRPAKWKTIAMDKNDPYYGNIAWQQRFPYNKSNDERLSWAAAAKPTDPGANEPILYNGTKLYQKEAVKIEQIFPPLYYKADVIDELAQLKTNINDYVNESIVRFIIGDMSIDKDWDKFVTQLDNIGLKRYLEINQKAYDDKYKK